MLSRKSIKLIFWFNLSPENQFYTRFPSLKCQRIQNFKSDISYCPFCGKRGETKIISKRPVAQPIHVHPCYTITIQPILAYGGCSTQWLWGMFNSMLMGDVQLNAYGGCSTQKKMRRRRRRPIWAKQSHQHTTLTSLGHKLSNHTQLFSLHDLVPNSTLIP